MIALLDYGAGNVRSVRNGIVKLGCTVEDVEKPEDLLRVEKLIFPGVGNFGVVMQRLRQKGYVEPLQERIRQGKPTFGICVALQALFEGSEESPGVPGLGIIPGMVRRFRAGGLAVPQIGWNGIKIKKKSALFAGYSGEKLYFVHSYKAEPTPENRDWVLATSDYGEEFIAIVARGNVVASQFHPEKSGEAGLRILDQFLKNREPVVVSGAERLSPEGEKTSIARRVIACLDVRSNDAGDLVVTKGDQYDVREQGEVRNLGKPVELARRYYEEGADEVTFLNITGFRDFPLNDQPMLEVLEETSKNVFVPLTIGGGIREFTDSDGKFYSALDVAGRYFRSGADKVSIGSDAVFAVEQYLADGKKTGKTAIEQISIVYGAQAVVISVDPRRVYVHSPDETGHAVIETAFPGPAGEKYCWYQCTVRGGREGRDLDVVQLAQSCEKLGAGEILLNCIDKDGTNSGFDLELIRMVKAAVSIPVIASSGAGCAAHFTEVFVKTGVEAALAAGIFHRGEVGIDTVKQAIAEAGVVTR
ncbi:MAG: imidazole glycerol phosphate synthase subunit HisF [Desulfopila sp.]